MFYFNYLQFLAHIIFIKVLDHTLCLLKKCLRGMLGAYEKSFKIMSRRRVRYKFFRVRYIAILRLLWVYRYNNQRGENLSQRLCYKMVFSAVPF